MAATRGRRPLLGVLTGGSGGTYIAPTLRNARGRGILLGIVGAGSAGRQLGPGEGAVADRLIALVDAGTATFATRTGSITDLIPVLTDTSTGIYATSTARRVRVTYLVLEVPDPPPTFSGSITDALQAVVDAATSDQISRIATMQDILAAVADAATGIQEQYGIVIESISAVTDDGTAEVGQPDPDPSGNAGINGWSYTYNWKYSN